MITTVTGKNQVTIPADVARKYRIEPGAQLEWQPGRGQDEITIRVHAGPRETLRLIRELGADYRGRSQDSATVLQQQRRSEDVDSAPRPYPTGVRKSKAR